MVYTTLSIVYGHIVDKKYLEDYLGVEFDDDYPEKDWIESPNCDNYILNIFRYPCCSKIAGKHFIIGHEVHQYYHKKASCDNCGKYTSCDTCIGTTTNGVYDVDKILNEVIEVDPKHICQHCYHDNKQNFMSCNLCGYDKKTNIATAYTPLKKEDPKFNL